MKATSVVVMEIAAEEDQKEAALGEKTSSRGCHDMASPRPPQHGLPKAGTLSS